jgi:hypothetical protein
MQVCHVTPSLSSTYLQIQSLSIHDLMLAIVTRCRRRWDLEEHDAVQVDEEALPSEPHSSYRQVSR